MMDIPLGRIRKIEIRPAAPRPPGHDDRAWKSGYEESDMDINDVLGKRFLGIAKGSGSYGHGLMSEFKCLEVSPSVQWLKVMNLDGVRFWCQRVNVSVCEILHPLKGPNEPKPLDDVNVECERALELIEGTVEWFGETGGKKADFDGTVYVRDGEGNLQELLSSRDTRVRFWREKEPPKVPPPVCPDCGEQMVKAKVENEEHDWSFVWMCGCEVDSEPDEPDPDRDAQEAVAHE